VKTRLSIRCLRGVPGPFGKLEWDPGYERERSPSERWAGQIAIGSPLYSWTIFESPRPQYRSLRSRL
jgi:hypothetical protein